MSPDAVLDQHDSRRLTQWQEFDKLSPIGPRRGDVQVATICKTLDDLLVLRRRGERGRPLSDFVFDGDFAEWHLEREATKRAEEDPETRAKLRAYDANLARAKAFAKARKRRKADEAAAAAAASTGRRRKRRR